MKVHDNCFLRFLMKVVKWFPVVFIAAAVVWSYYAYVVELCIFTIPHDAMAQKVLYLIFYHIFLILFAWSYWQCIFSEPARVPPQFALTTNQLSQLEPLFRAKDFNASKSLLEKFAKDLPLHNKGYDGGVRYCEKCTIIKPDRAHHCSVCGRCVMKMDHHCPWVNNCVCYNNYKFFILFLGYAIIYCLYISLTDLEFFIKFWTEGLSSNAGRFHILFLFFVSTMFLLSLVTLFIFHLYLVLLNRSTLENYRPPQFRGGPDKNGFNLGKSNNFKEVFGSKPVLWFLPVFTSKGDGASYPVFSRRNLAYETDAPNTGTTNGSRSGGTSNQHFIEEP